MSQTTVPAYRAYLGQAYFDVHGRLVNEVGDHNQEVAAQKIERANTDFKGRWSYAIVRSMRQANHRSREEWTNTMLFPDGKSRRLHEGEIQSTLKEGTSKGKWITLDMAKKCYANVKVAPAQRFPYGERTLECKLNTFANLLAFERFCQSLATPLYIMPVTENPPDQNALYVYMVVAQH